MCTQCLLSNDARTKRDRRCGGGGSFVLPHYVSLWSEWTMRARDTTLIRSPLEGKLSPVPFPRRYPWDNVVGNTLRTAGMNPRWIPIGDGVHLASSLREERRPV